jgi:hypothetical protein
MSNASDQESHQRSIAARMAVLAGLIFGIPTLIAAVAGDIMGHLGTNSDAIPYVLAVTTAIAMITLFAILQTAKVRRRRRFQARDVLTEDEWFDHYYGETEFPQPVVLSVLSAFAAEVGGNIRPTQLRPDDRLEDFALTFWGIVTDDSFETAECHLAIALGSDFEPDASWTTLGDLIVGACRQTSALSASPSSHGR